MIGRAIAAFGLCCLPGCGSNLMVVRSDVVLPADFGDPHVLRIEFQPPYGIGHAEDLTLGQLLGGLAVEPLDWIWSTFGALTSPFGNHRVLGGPFGWVASLTPFATLVPGMYVLPRPPEHVDPAMLLRLHGQDAEDRVAAARELLRDDRIVSAWLLRAPGAPAPK